MSVEEARAWFVARGGGITPGEQLFYERVAAILEPGETLESRVLINCESAIGSALVTDRRLVHIGNVVLKGMQVKAVARADITSVELGGLIFGKLTIKHANGTLKLDGAKELAKQFKSAIGY